MIVATKTAPSFPYPTDEYEPTNARLWESVLEVARGDRQEYRSNGRVIHAPNNGGGFKPWPHPNGTAWAVKQYNGFRGGWKLRKKEASGRRKPRMSIIALRVPHETSRLLSGIDVPGDREDRTGFHITVFYLGEDLPIATLAEAIKVTWDVTSRTPPFTVKTSKVTTFPKGEDGVPIIMPIDSAPLHTLRNKLKEAYEANGIPFSNRWPEYRPHVTLAYADEAVEDREIGTIEWAAHELTLWGGDDADNGLTTTFPFSVFSQMAGSKLGRRVASRWASRII